MSAANLIETPFGFDTTAKQAIEGVDLSGKRAIVTGGASGIGVETVRALAGAGAEVTIAARNAAVAAAVAVDTSPAEGAGSVLTAPLELADRASIDAFVAAWEGPLDILVNNAGVMAIQELTRSPEGHEMQFAVNHLGHFRMTTGLHGALAAAKDGARVVSVSSRGHLRSPVIFDDLDYRFRPYDPWIGYGQSKTANVLFAVEITRRWTDDGILSNAVMPGGIDTPLQRHLPDDFLETAVKQMAEKGMRLKTTEEGAATSALLAASPLLEGVGARYFEDCNEAELVHESGGMGTGGVAPYALDPANAERLWNVSLELMD